MAARADVLDAAMLAVVDAVRDGDEPLVLGGRSSGARVACRTARAADGAGVLALAFPLHPPWKPESSRLPELTGAGVPALVVQGERDRFGGAEALAAELAASALATADAATDSAVDVAAGIATGIELLPVPNADHSLDRAFDVNRVVSWTLQRIRR
jgi:predicted alpha/beta-hydrolase family hydrolase